MATYNPAVFNVRTIAEAKRIILTDERGVSSEERWQRETPYLMGLIREHLQLNADSLVVDYGCGIGRLAKELIAEYGCRVVGVDISSSMRGLAESYVGSDRFVACSPEWFRLIGSKCGPADAAVAVWALQHSLDPEMDISDISGALEQRGRFLVANSIFRLVPTLEAGWAGDGKNIEQQIGRLFECVARDTLDAAHVGHDVATTSFWGTYENKTSRS